MAKTMDQVISRLVTYLNADITQIGIGTGTTPLTNSSTLLDNETLRKPTTNTVDGNTIIAEAYWDETEGNGVTYTEAAAFGNGATASIDTGEIDVGDQINIEKDSTQTLTISVELNVEAVNT